MPANRVTRIGFVVALGFAGCRAVLGIEDSSVVAEATDAGAKDDDAAEAASEAEAATEASVCDALGTPQNCGSCGHDCQEGACQNGKCRPVSIQEIAADYMLPALGSQYVFVSSRPGPSVYRVHRGTGQVGSTSFAGAGTVALRVRDGFVYFADQDGQRILRLSEPGEFSLTKHIDTSLWSGFSVYEVFVDDDAIYFPDACLDPSADKVWRANLDGSGVAAVATGLHCINELEADANDLWAASYEEPVLYRLAKSSLPLDAGVVPMATFGPATNLECAALELDSGYAYVGIRAKDGTAANGTGIYRVKKVGAVDPELVVPDAVNVFHLTLSGNHLYWVEREMLGLSTGKIGRIDTTQANPVPEILITDLPSPIGLVVDGEVIYFTSAGLDTRPAGIYRVVL